jgi:hypothetical protein
METKPVSPIPTGATSSNNSIMEPNRSVAKDGSSPLTSKMQAPLMRKIQTKNNTPFLVIGSLLVVLAGVGTGWLLSGANAQTSNGASEVANQQSEIKQSDTEAGIDDSEAFPDTAEGMLVKGGIDGEGTYHLERTGGVSQNVYLTSTVIDLASFEGKKVQVWGQSLAGKKAGWLMDVGRLKVVE